MTETRLAARRSRRRNRILAIAAAGTVFAAGITVPSLAAWTDVEWVAGGAGNVPGVTTQIFEVQQYAAGDTDWANYETETDANVIDFSAAAATLTPGTTVYAYVRLRTTANSLGGTLTLRAPTAVTPGTLSAALQYGARIVPAVSDCADGTYTGSGTTLLQASGSALNVTSNGTFSLAPDGATTGASAEKIVCFELTLPLSFANNSSVMGQTVIPIWRFDATSV